MTALALLTGALVIVVLLLAWRVRPSALPYVGVGHRRAHYDAAYLSSRWAMAHLAYAAAVHDAPTVALLISGRSQYTYWFQTPKRTLARATFHVRFDPARGLSVTRKDIEQFGGAKWSRFDAADAATEYLNSIDT